MEAIKPFSKTRRRIQLALLVVLFIIIGPILVLFASGYSFQDILSFTKIELLSTGGIYVAEIGSNSIVTLDNDEFKQSSFLDRTVLFQRLTTDVHEIKINRPLYREWSKEVTVYPNRVTEIRPVLILEKIVVTPAVGTTTIADLKSILKSKNSVATSTIRDASNSNFDIELKGGDISISWKTREDAPYYLCSALECVASTSVYLLETIHDFEWFPGRNDALITITNSTISVVELDPRNGRKITPIIALSDYVEEKVRNLKNNQLKPSLITYQGSIYFEVGGAFFRIDL
jgi:hypothetical protein